MNEIQYDFDGQSYLIKKLPLGAAKEVLLRLTKIGFFAGTEGFDISAITKSLRIEDLDFFEQKLFGSHLSVMNDDEKWVPLGKAIAASHFEGRLGQYFHMIAKCLVVNFSDFLVGLHIDMLAPEETEAG